MKRLGRVFFAAFYIWATINVAGERSARAVYRIENWSKAATGQIDAPTQRFTEVLPNFGHAKKASPAVADVSLELTHVLLFVERRYEERPDVEYSSADSFKVHSSRAPPALI